MSQGWLRTQLEIATKDVENRPDWMKNLADGKKVQAETTSFKPEAERTAQPKDQKAPETK